MILSEKSARSSSSYDPNFGQLLEDHEVHINNSEVESVNLKELLKLIEVSNVSATTLSSCLINAS